MNFVGKYDVIAGTNLSIQSRGAWKPSPATAAILGEMCQDTDESLVYAAGSSPIELALAWFSKPKISGCEHPGLVILQTLVGGCSPILVGHVVWLLF
nr:hypothetical protein [Sphingomonas sp. CDS-1]